MRPVLNCIWLGAIADIRKHKPKAEALKSLGEALDGLGAGLNEADDSES